MLYFINQLKTILNRIEVQKEVDIDKKNYKHAIHKLEKPERKGY